MTEEQVRARRHRGRRHRRPSVRDLPEIFFCGDPHGTFDQINEAARLYSPDAVADSRRPSAAGAAARGAGWRRRSPIRTSGGFRVITTRIRTSSTTGCGEASLRATTCTGASPAWRACASAVWAAFFVVRSGMPDGNPNYYSPATFMRRVGQGNIWRGGVPRRHRSTALPVRLRQPSEAEGRHSRDARGPLVSQEGLLRTRQACQDDGREVAFPRAPARGPRLRHAGLDSHPCSRLQRHREPQGRGRR